MAKRQRNVALPAATDRYLYGTAYPGLPAQIGYNNPHIATPTLDALAAGGLKLTSSYVYKCKGHAFPWNHIAIIWR